MHANAILLNHLFTALDGHDPQTMAQCYHPDATFRDIAFDLEGRREIHTMWHMICSGDIRVEFEILDADDRSGHVRLVDTYTMSDGKDPPRRRRAVRNTILSTFTFEDGFIRSQVDECDEKSWARQAVGGPGGFLAGRFRPLRSFKARRKLARFVATHEEHK